MLCIRGNKYFNAYYFQRNSFGLSFLSAYPSPLGLVCKKKPACTDFLTVWPWHSRRFCFAYSASKKEMVKASFIKTFTIFMSFLLLLHLFPQKTCRCLCQLSLNLAHFFIFGKEHDCSHRISLRNNRNNQLMVITLGNIIL